MKKQNELKLNKESVLYRRELSNVKKWIENWGEDYKEKRNGRKGWCVVKNGEIWREGFDNEKKAWMSLIGGIGCIVNLWDYGWMKLNEGIKDEGSVIGYMREVCEECGIKCKMSKWGDGDSGELVGWYWRCEIEKKDYKRLREELLRDFGWEIKYIE